jgi:hypothetical protein
MKDILGSSIIISLSLFFYALTFNIQTIAGFEKMTPSFWPRFNLIGIIVLSLYVIMKDLLSRTKSVSREARVPKEQIVLKLALSVLILFSWIFCMPYLGFLLTSLLATACLVYILGESKKVALLFSFVLVFFIYIVFGKLMYVPMPRGVWIIQEISYYLY